jgi:hypothetical protein
MMKKSPPKSIMTLLLIVERTVNGNIDTGPENALKQI